MLKAKYLLAIKQQVKKAYRKKGARFFVFGSSVNKTNFGDIDLGVMGEVDSKLIRNLKENFEESNLPYKVDVVNFEKVSSKFKNNVFSEKILWIKR